MGRGRVVIVAGVGMLAEKCAVYAGGSVYIAVIIRGAATIIITLLQA